MEKIDRNIEFSIYIYTLFVANALHEKKRLLSISWCFGQSLNVLKPQKNNNFSTVLVYYIVSHSIYTQTIFVYQKSKVFFK